MHHTQDDYPSPTCHEIDLTTKKVKRSNLPTHHSKSAYKNNNIDHESFVLNTKQSSSTFVMDVDNLAQNDMVKLTILPKLLAQSSSSTVIPNRKRRYRNSQEISAADASAACSTANINGQLRKKSDLSCVVCGAVAHGYNFDAISCESCKAFFRRNALTNTDRLKCRRDQACDITLETRRRCKCCRLKKCFGVGMRKEWILTEEEKVNKKRRIEENRRLRVPDTDEILPSKDCLRKNDLDLQNVLLTKTGKSSLKSTLAVHKIDIIADVVSAYNDSIRLDVTGYGWSYPIARKITALCQIINTRNTTALRLINFYKNLYDFDILNEVDKVNLIKNNLHYIFFFHASLKYDPIHDVYHEENTNDKPIYGADVREAYGTDIYTRLTKVMRALHSIVQIDKRLMQVALVIFLFSKGLSTTTTSANDSSVNNNNQYVFHIQDTYTEQLWLFIEKRYGRVRAVDIFSTLISKCLLIQQLIRDIQHDVYEKLDPCEVPPILQSIMQSA